MMLSEFYDTAPEGYTTPKDDNSSLKLDDSRKTRLTLSQINRLRLMNDVLKFEHEKQLERVSKQYRPPAEPGMMGAGSPASL